jgi:hypothetical protein
MRVKVKLKFNVEQATKDQMGSRCIDLLSVNLGAGLEQVVNATTQPLYARRILGTHCKGGWIGPRPHIGIQSPDRAARSK